MLTKQSLAQLFSTTATQNIGIPLVVHTCGLDIWVGSLGDVNFPQVAQCALSTIKKLMCFDNFAHLSVCFVIKRIENPYLSF